MMLIFNQLIVRNFGPFKGSQVIDFPIDHGVSIIYGQNMRGKTTLLNAIRFVLYGSILSRGSKIIEYHKVINSEAADIGDYEFSVTLEFSYNNHNYKLTRIARPNDSTKKPDKHDDYKVDFFLSQDNTIQSMAARDILLEQIMPEQVSRFFLFDGELLQEYEELVSVESDAGRKIKESIERILGVPILTNTRSDIESLKKVAQQTESKTAQADKSTNEIGVLLSAKYEERDNQDEELLRLQNERINKFNEKQELSAELKKNQKAQNLLVERETLQELIKGLRKKISEKKERIKDYMSNSWQWMVLGKLSQISNQNEEEISTLKNEITSSLFSEEYKKLLNNGIESCICPACEQDLNSEKIVLLQNKISILGARNSDTQNARLDLLQSQSTKIKELTAVDKKDVVIEILKDINDIKIEISDTEEQIKEINSKVEGIDVVETRRLYINHEKAIKDLALLDEGITSQQKLVSDINLDIEKLSHRLSSLSGHNLKKDTYRRELCSKLYDLFNIGVSKYRDILRDKIQSDASKLFLSLTTEPDFQGLRINDNYGLNIIGRSGQDVPVRSAGAEHIVALSLMGALQKNAPFSGPIIMDSPFGRLDDQHTRNVVKSLPLMAKQVVLLVFKVELESNLAKEELKENLFSEYQLSRHSSTFTELEKLM